MKVLFDTSVLVASLVAKHPHHQRAMAVIERVLKGSDSAVVAAHALVETYSVLTRLPVTPRIGASSDGSAADCMRLTTQHCMSLFPPNSCSWFRCSLLAYYRACRQRTQPMHLPGRSTVRREHSEPLSFIYLYAH